MQLTIASKKNIPVTLIKMNEPHQVAKVLKGSPFLIIFKP